MNLRTRSLVVLTVFLCLASVGLARGGWPCKLCSKCQSECEPCEQPQHVCEPVCEKKPITKVIYKVKCIPYCRHKCPCSCCKEGCDPCDSCVYYRKVLLKKTVKTGEETVVRCQVKDLCPRCGGMCSEGSPVGAAPKKGTPVHPLPVQEKEASDPPPKPTREVRTKSASANDSNVDAGTPAPLPDEEV